MEGKTDVRILKTKTRLIRALSELTQDREPEDISVSELCKKAGVNRTTFYKYYQVPADVGKESFERHMRELMEEMHREKESTLYDTLLYCCREYQKNYLITKQVFPGFTVSDETLQNLYLHLQRPYLFKNPDTLYFIAGGSALLVRRWLSEKPEVPPEEIARELASYITAVMKSGAAVPDSRRSTHG